MTRSHGWQVGADCWLAGNETGAVMSLLSFFPAGPLHWAFWAFSTAWQPESKSKYSRRQEIATPGMGREIGSIPRAISIGQLVTEPTQI